MDKGALSDGEAEHQASGRQGDSQTGRGFGRDQGRDRSHIEIPLRYGIDQAIGTGRLLDDGSRGELQVKKHDEVVFTSYAGTEIRVEGEEYLIMDESDILGVVG